ncbi:MAG: Fic family protein [Bacteroidota bacterium]|jgi:Fic family protein
MYNWELKDWPKFTYSLIGLEDTFTKILRNEGRFEGIVKQLPNNIQATTLIEMMIVEAMKTSEIEGEFFSRKDVMSSIKKNLGLAPASTKITNKNAEGISKVMIEVRNTYQQTLTQDTLFNWHKMLLLNQKNINTGQWRKHKEPMQVVSGAIGKEKVHFEAPPSKQVDKEMQLFLKWFNATAPNGKKHIVNGVVRSAIAHLYFLSIHPFEDGNGSIGRAIAEKALSQNAGAPILISISYVLEKNKKEYYNQLQKAQKTNNLTGWINYFAKVILEAQAYTEQKIEFTLKKIKFLETLKPMLNGRQLKVLLKMFDAGSEGFVGGMNAAKYMRITKTSKATATRDLQELLLIKAIISEGGGRSTRYNLTPFYSFGKPNE